METPVVTPSDPGAPTIDINTPAADIRAAITQEAAPAPPPAEPQPYTLDKQPDGQFHVKLQTGEEFRGTAEDVLAKIAKSKVDTTLWARDIEAKSKAAAPAPVAAEPVVTPPTAPQLTDEDLNYQYVELLTTEGKAAADDFYAQHRPDAVLAPLAKALGYDSVEDFKGELKAMTQTTQEAQARTLAMGFAREAPDFPDTQEASAALGQFMEAQGWQWTPKNMAIAHRELVRSGAYQALSAEQVASARGQQAPKPQVPQPAPMISPSAPQAAEVLDPWNMPLDQLREAARREGQQ